MELNYQRLQHQITGMDEAYIAGYNKYKGIGHQYLIHTKIKPCPFEGDLEQVVVLILLANPMYSHSSSSETDHVISNLQRGWGIFSLAPSSNEGIRNWWIQHLAPLQQQPRQLDLDLLLRAGATEQLRQVLQRAFQMSLQTRH
jgi:hypothetical protein